MRLFPHLQSSVQPVSATAVQQHALAAACSLLVFTTAAPASAVPSLAQLHESVEFAAMKVAQSADPVLRSIHRSQAESVSVKIDRSLLKANPDELQRTVDLGLETLLALPEGRVKEAAESLGATFDLPPDQCSDRLPLPRSMALVRLRDAASDPAKLAVAQKALKPLARAIRPEVSADEGAYICLPPRAALERLAVEQIDLASAADLSKRQALEAQARAALRTVPPQDAVALLAEQTKLGELPQRQRFKAACAKLDAAGQAEARRAKEAATPLKCYTMSCYDYAEDGNRPDAFRAFAGYGFAPF